jgi:hypothetical protein
MRIEQEQMTGRIGLETQKRDLLALASANSREEADTKAYGLSTMVKAFAGADPKLLQALASVGMEPSQLMALALRDLADNATKIGELNVSPDLLREIMRPETPRQESQRPETPRAETSRPKPAK